MTKPRCTAKLGTNIRYSTRCQNPAKPGGTLCGVHLAQEKRRAAKEAARPAPKPAARATSATTQANTAPDRPAPRPISRQVRRQYARLVAKGRSV